MIGSIIFIIVGIVVGLFFEIAAFVTSFLTVLFPSQFTEAIDYFLEYLLYFQDYYNIVDTIEAFLWFLGFLYILLLYKGFKFVWAHMPWVGTSNTTTMFTDHQGNAVPRNSMFAMVKTKTKRFK